MENPDDKSLEKLVELLKAGAIDEKTFLELTTQKNMVLKATKTRNVMKLKMISFLALILFIAGIWFVWTQLFDTESKVSSPEDVAKAALPYFESYAKSNAGGFQRMTEMSLANSDAEWYAQHQFNIWKARGEENYPEVSKLDGSRVTVCGRATIEDDSCRLNTKYSNFVFGGTNSVKLLKFDIDGVPIRDRRKYASVEDGCRTIGNEYCGTSNSFVVEVQTTYLAASDSLFVTYTIIRGSSFNRGFSYDVLGATANIPGVGLVKSGNYSSKGPPAGKTMYEFVAFENMSVAKGKSIEIMLTFSYDMKFKITVQI